MTETATTVEDEGPISSIEVVQIAGITFRQLDYWATHGLLRPLPRRPPGSRAEPGTGVPRRWPPGEVEVARVMGRLIAAGLPLQTAAQIARSGQSRNQIAPGIWLEYGTPPCRACEADDHGACFPDEPSDCGCACREDTGAAAGGGSR